MSINQENNNNKADNQRDDRPFGQKRFHDSRESRGSMRHKKDVDSSESSDARKHNRMSANRPYFKKDAPHRPHAEDGRRSEDRGGERRERSSRPGGRSFGDRRFGDRSGSGDRRFGSRPFRGERDGTSERPRFSRGSERSGERSERRDFRGERTERTGERRDFRGGSREGGRAFDRRGGDRRGFGARDNRGGRTFERRDFRSERAVEGDEKLLNTVNTETEGNATETAARTERSRDFRGERSGRGGERSERRDFRGERSERGGSDRRGGDRHGFGSRDGRRDDRGRFGGSRDRNTSGRTDSEGPRFHFKYGKSRSDFSKN